MASALIQTNGAPHLTPPQGVMLDDAIESVLARAQDRRAEHTVAAYRNDLLALGAAVGIGDTATVVLRHLLVGGALEAAEVLDRWQAQMEAAGAAPATVSRRITGVLACLSLFRRRGWIQWSVRPDGLHTTPRRNTDGPPLAVVQQLLAAAAEQADQRQARRDVALLWLLTGCGLRASEAAGLLIGNVHPSDRTISVVRKGARRVSGAQRVATKLPVSQAVMDALQGWIVCREGAQHHDRVFVRTDAAGRGQPLGDDGVRNIIVRLGSLIGVKLWPHALRHTAISEAARLSKGDVRAVQRFAGHRSVNMTMIYVNKHQDYDAIKGVGDLIAGALAQKNPE